MTCKLHPGMYVNVQPVKTDTNGLNVPDGQPFQIYSCCFNKDKNSGGCVEVTKPASDVRCTVCGIFKDWTKPGDKCEASHGMIQCLDGKYQCSNMKCLKTINDESNKPKVSKSKWDKVPVTYPKGCKLLGDHKF